MARTTEAEVRAVIETDPDISIDPFISHAGVLTDRMEINATEKGYTLTAAELALVETYLAAHFYALRDRQAETEREGRSSVKYMGKLGYGLEATPWGQQALTIDYTGSLAKQTGSSNTGNSNSVGLVWLGEEDDA